MLLLSCGNNTLFIKSDTKLVKSPNSLRPSNKKNILFFGDSLTAAMAWRTRPTMPTLP